MNLNEPNEMPESSDAGFDLDASMDSIAGGLGLAGGKRETAEMAQPDEGTEPAVAAAAPEPLAPPKSWAKEMHEHWGKIPRPAQEYYNTREKQMLDGLEQYKTDAGFAKSMREIFQPYVPTLKSQGISEGQAIGYLLNAHYRLSTGSAEERAAAYRQIGEELGLVQSASGEQQQIDPALARTQKEVQELKTEREREKAQRAAELRAKYEAETNTFASDPANVYFAEVAQDMLPFVQAGASLKDAYEKAIWANPVTRAKEQARLTADAEKQKLEKARVEGQAAKRATSVNVRGNEARRAPTEPQGTMDDTMRETLKSIRNRAH